MTTTPTRTTPVERTVLVWDLAVRIFHWSLVVSYLGAYFATDDGDLPHRVLGYIALGLIAWRLVWGFIGSKHARFADFVPRPRAFFTYVRDALRGREARYLGHNPAGALMVIALLLTVITCSVSGWLLTTDAFWGSEMMEAVHEISANIGIFLVLLHVSGVVYESWHQRENLVKAMLTGRKRL